MHAQPHSSSCCIALRGLLQTSWQREVALVVEKHEFVVYTKPMQPAMLELVDEVPAGNAIAMLPDRACCSQPLRLCACRQSGTLPCQPHVKTPSKEMCSSASTAASATQMHCKRHR